MGRRALVVTVGLLAALAAVLTLLGTRHGPGISPDSLSYLAAARNLTHGRGLTDIDGTTFTRWPPGYPLVLAGANGLGVSLADAARALDVVCAGGTVVLAAVLLRSHVRSDRLVIAGTAFVAIAPALLRTTVMAWSEPLFTVLTVGFVVVLERACESERAVDVVLAGALATGASLVRYLGFALIAAGVVALVLRRRASWRATAVRVVWFAVVAVSGPVLFALRNIARDAPALGGRAGGPSSVVSSLGDAVRELVRGSGRLVVPAGVPGALTALAGLGVLAVVAVGVVRAVQLPTGSALVPVLTVLITTILFTIVARLQSGADISARILAPLVPLLVVVAAWLVESWSGVWATHAGRVVGWTVLGATACLLIGWTAWSVGLAVDRSRHPSSSQADAPAAARSQPPPVATG